MDIFKSSKCAFSSKFKLSHAFLNWEKKPAIETKWDSINGQHFDLINKAGQLSLFDKQKPWEKWNE